MRAGDERLHGMTPEQERIHGFYYDKGTRRFLCLDPANPDTEPIEPDGSSVLSGKSPQDGDGVPDGVEVTDSNYELGRTDSRKNKLGYWPDEEEFCKLDDDTYDYSQSTNPLDRASN